MEQLGDCSSFTQSNIGQKLVIILDGSSRNKGFVQKTYQKPVVKVNIPPSSISSTSISVRKSMQNIPRNNCIVKKQETISGNHTTHIQKSTHHVKQRPRTQQQQQQQRQQQQQQQQRKTTSRPQQYKGQIQVQVPRNSGADDEFYSDDNIDPRKVNLELVKRVKKMLRKYIEELPSRKLKSGEYTWSEIKPYIRDLHYPRFKKYLRKRNIQAPSSIIIRCLKDLHVSRRDVWLKKQRKLREQRSKGQIDNAEAQSPRSDGYVSFIPRVVIYN